MRGEDGAADAEVKVLSAMLEMNKAVRGACVDGASLQSSGGSTG